MKWVTVAPTKRGYYWAYESLDEQDADVLLVYLRGDDEEIVCWANDGMRFSVQDFSRWMGPLEFPAPPQIKVKNK